MHPYILLKLAGRRSLELQRAADIEAQLRNLRASERARSNPAVAVPCCQPVAS